MTISVYLELSLHLHGNEKLEEETSKIFNLFLINSEEGDVSKFQGVHLNDILKVKDWLHLDIFRYDISFVDGELIGELCRRSIRKYEKGQAFTLQQSHLLRQQHQRIVQSLPVYYV